MKIAVMGSGGVGGYFGARLAAAGEDVTFVARGEHLAAIRDRGLAVRSPLGDFRVDAARATDCPVEVGPVEAVLFATKLYDVDEAAEACRPLVGEDTVVVSLLNGIDSEERLARVLGETAVAGGVAHVSAGIDSPGVIRHHAPLASLRFGEMSGAPSPRLERLREVAAAAGIDARLSRDVRADIWRKFIFLAGFSGVTALTRLPVGTLRDVPETWALLEHAMAEVTAVARASGIRLPADVTQSCLDIARGLAAHVRASMLADLERGRRLELRWLSGAVSRHGRALGVPTPVHDLVLAALLPWADGPPPDA